MAVFNNILAGASGQAGGAGYEIERSLRFNSADSSYLSRGSFANSDTKTMTFSFWLKRSALTAQVATQYIFSGGSNGTIFFDSGNGDKLSFNLRGTSGTNFFTHTLAELRDVGAWYHIVVALDFGNATQSERFKCYINGVEQGMSATAYPNNAFHAGGTWYIGSYTGTQNYPSFYLADFHYVAGQALDPTDFGEFDDNGVWQPIEYAASGPNNGTTWSDSVTTADGESTSNTFDRLFDGSLSTVAANPDNTGADEASAITFTPTSPISYTNSVEVYHRGASGNAVGKASLNDGATVNCTLGQWNTIATGSGSITKIEMWIDPGTTSIGENAAAAIRVDGVTLIDGDTANIGANGFHLDFANGADLGNDVSGNNNDWTPNNLVGELQTGDLGMDVVTYTGNGSTQTISGLKFQPDLLWIKSRSAAYSHRLYDSIRGVSDALYPDLTDAEGASQGTNENLTSFTSDGFSLGAATGIDAINANTVTFVAWAWKAGGTPSSNTDGTITSSVSANTTYGFSIVSYTGNGTAGATIGHGLGVQPHMVIYKNRDSATDWVVGHVGADLLNAPDQKRLILNGTQVAVDDGGSYFNDTNPTSSVITLGNHQNVNENTKKHVGYFFAPVAGYSAFGSYTGNGSTTGPIVTTGFKPGWLMIKRSDSADSWQILDATRSPSNPADDHLFADLSNAEGSTASRGVDFLSNGFQLRGDNGGINASGGTYIYAAFAAGTPGEDLDLLFDSATNGTQEDTGAGGEVSGNYCTLNPLFSSTTLTNGNLDAEGPSNAWHIGRGTFAFPTSDKWYWEATVKGTSSASYAISVATASAANSVADFTTGTGYYGVVNNTGSTTNKVSNGTATTISTAAAWAQNDILMCAYDGATGKVWFGRNGTWYPPTSGGSAGNPGAGTNETMTASGTVFPAVHCYGTSGDMTVNFGQRPFAYSAPSGFKALCTTNLDDPTIADGSTAMDVALYTGNGSTQTISGLDFSPDFVWTKRRDGASSHGLFDVIRGATKWLGSNSTNSEQTYSDSLISFDSDGFTLGADTVWNGINQSSQTYVAWTWDAGTSTVSNTDGSITSSVRANASAGFSVVTATGSSSSSATVGHGLNAAPELIFVKLRVTAGNGFDQDWQVYHSSIGNTGGLKLNTTAATETSSAIWNNTSPTSTTFSIGASSRYDGNFVAYCFTPVEGYSAFGSYTGNGSTNGPFVYTGFRPRWIMTKRTDATGEWWISDSARDTYNAASTFLWAQSSGAEVSSTSYDYDILSNGFKLKTTYADRNASGGTFVYAAFAENPFKTARAR
jgi:hypothetical protein